MEDLTGWEAEHGRIPDGAILLVRTGWGTRYGDRTAYLGTDLDGPDAVPQLHFPGLSPEAAQWLVDNRKIAAFGLDTPSVDYGQSSDFRVHQIMYGANIPGFENVANLDQLPATGRLRGRAADEDQGRQRGAAPDRGVRALNREAHGGW